MALVTFLLFPLSLSAQAPFPLTPALETACFGGIFAPAGDSVFGSAWRPDWPDHIPPDAFRVKGDAALIRLSGSLSRYEGSEDPVPFEYRLSRDRGGRLVEFPLSLGGNFFQIRADYAPSGALAALLFSGAGGEWTAEFPLPYVPFESAPPQLPEEAVRVSREGSVYFVLFEEGGRHIAESWYDPEGRLAGYFVSLFEEGEERRRILSVLSFEGAERYHFESGASVSAIRSGRGAFSAVYGAKGQVLEREFVPPEPALKRPGRFAFQWDENLLLVSMRDIPGSLEFRYEYSLDQRGNWLSRRETAYTARGGLLIPSGARGIDRTILYRGEE